jgi:hypothetical protein
LLRRLRFLVQDLIMGVACCYAERGPLPKPLTR